MTLNEKDLGLFKTWLRSHLATGEVTVTFTKKDGSERVMKCTTSASLVPPEPLISTMKDKLQTAGLSVTMEVNL